MGVLNAETRLQGRTCAHHALGHWFVFHGYITDPDTRLAKVSMPCFPICWIVTEVWTLSSCSLLPWAEWRNCFKEPFFALFSFILHLCLFSQNYSLSIIRNISEEFISFCQVSGLTLNLEQSFQSTINSVFLHATVKELRAVLSHVHSGCFGGPMGQVDFSSWKLMIGHGYNQHVIFCITVYMWVCLYVKAFTWFTEAIRRGMAYHHFRQRSSSKWTAFSIFPRGAPRGIQHVGGRRLFKSLPSQHPGTQSLLLGWARSSEW